MTDDVPTAPAAAAPAAPRHRSPLLAVHGAVAAGGADAGVAWHYGDPTAEQRALARGGAVVDQSHLGVVTVTGPDRLTWLHSLTTQDVAALPPRTSTELLVLDPHGHVEHAVGLVDDGTTAWLLTETAPALAAWLDRMRFTLRVEVADVTDAWAALAEPVDAEGGEGEPVTWRDPWPRTAPGGTRYGAADDEHPGADRRWRIVLVPRERLVEEVRTRQAAGWPLVGTWASEALRVEAWRPRTSHEVDDRTIPHELDWLRTAVHLNKGCYRGQETVARVHNLGRPPRRLVMLHLDGSGHLVPEVGAAVRLPGASAPTAGGAETAEAGRQVGRVTSVARHHELGPIALAVVKRSVPTDAVLLVDCDGGAVAAGQEVVVDGEGVTPDRPAARGPLARGLGQHPMLGA
ncbi:CAF17-like 4Fe-4S cluster assembly/insertion protein YgfZ [Cellulomonas dongxiuzhuiae]|uniref:Folate-binding protein n=1 Tax=Cellulomonas dongxiuzhuiae TaxID=2819979 RepID=A0ABX8GI15_9CELL|nr:folate-binding protein YgfZ [Cellulomonas dongxiuzhuiae]MBO3087986.1 folate-binding protein YgfZ [Cellulomonas dongxiuzhuiae]MBO3094662.1 folate-binding protein YgfZ [Cellulomonas dongxiuzhuiae]QWC15669.1 folate-binding protein [Cellulomonas dongxiuzhuiae]